MSNQPNLGNQLSVKLLKIGIVRVMSANIINKVVTFISNIILVRVLTQYDYGILSDVNNTYALFLLFEGLGTLSGVLVYGSEKRSDEEKYQYFRFSIKIGIAFNSLISICMCIYGALGLNEIKESNKYILYMSLLPFLSYFMQYFQALMRCKEDNKRYAILLNVNTISYCFFSVLGAYIYGISGAILGRYISSIISCMVGLWYSKDIIFYVIKSRIDKRCNRREFLKYCMGVGTSSAISTAFFLIDVMLVGQLIGNAEISAIYKVATMIPDNLNVIPMSVIVVILPRIAIHNKEPKVLKGMCKKLLLVNGTINLVMTTILVFIAPWLIDRMWGHEYMSSVLPFRILCISFFFMATIKLLCNNVLSAIKRVKEVLIISIVSLVMNIILDYVCIANIGMVGAAIATLLVSIIASIVAVVILIRCLNAMEKVNAGYNS